MEKRLNIPMRVISIVVALAVCLSTSFSESVAESLPPTHEYIEYTPGSGIAVPDLDLTVKPSTVFVFQGTPDPNRGGGGKFGVSWVLYLDMEKKFGDFGKAFVQVKSGWGDTIERDLNLFSNVNYNAYDVGGNVRCRKFWYEQYLFDNQIKLSCGRYNTKDLVAQNRYSHDDDTQFIGWLFNKLPVIEFSPDYSFTIHGGIYPKAIDFLELEFNFFEGDADWKQIFKRGIFTAQINIKPASLIGANPDVWGGNYRFYAWLNSRKHSKLVDSGQPETTDTKESNYGFGLSFDQQIAEVYGVFGRVGWERPDVIPANGGATIELAWFIGAQMTGQYWKRQKDVFAIGVGQVMPSAEYKDAGNDARIEGHVEMYYRCQINEVFSISPNFQIIWNPGGADRSQSDPVFAYGLRTRVCF
jgi:carbohydrate-selective porin OprB